MVIVPYWPVRDEALRQIVELKLKKIQQRVVGRHGISLTYEDAVIGEIAARCTEVESGARNVDNILTNTMLPEISGEILGQIADGNKPESVHVSLDRGGFVYHLTQGAARRDCVASYAD